MFNTSNGGYGLADIAAVTGNRNNGYDDGFGWGNGNWWIIILFLFCFCGWGGNGWGNRYGDAVGATDNYVLASDFATLQRQIDSASQSLERKGDSIQEQLCGRFYDMNTMFSNTNQNIMNGFNTQNLANLQNTNAIQRDIYSGTVQGMQNTNALQQQLAQCCCENREAIAQVRYDMATDTCAIETNSTNNTRDIIEANNANTRSILDAIQQTRVEAMQEKINSLQLQNQGLQFAASQQSQNAYLLDQLKPTPSPAYLVSNPYCNCGNGYAYSGCGTCAG